MKKMALLVVGMVLMACQAMAERAAATFTSEKGHDIQVIINRQVINSEPKPVVKVKGTGGVHLVKIKIFNGKEEIEIKQELKISAGYHNNYIISVTNNHPEVKKISSSRLYNYRFKRPDKFYNRRFFAFLNVLIKKNPALPDEMFESFYYQQNPSVAGVA